MTQTMTEGLLPCPFCGDDQDSFAGMIPEAFAKGSEGTFSVRCYCGALGPLAPTMAEAVAAWNRRASPASPEGAALGLKRTP